MRTHTSAGRELNLPGCTSVPLASYLKGLGVFRIVSEQADDEATAAWRDTELALGSSLDREELEALLLERYRPTPIVAPWNGGSGFYPKDNQAGISVIGGSRTDRLAPYREVLASCREALQELRGDEAPKDRKVTLLERLRARLPEAALPWIDAAVVLTAEGPGYPPLLGTGGNDGRLDFTNNFMQRLAELLDPETGSPTPPSRDWLRGALFGDAIPGLTSSPIGQFAPGDAGGANASTGFGGDARINPWDFVLMLEGAVLFAAASTRRLDSGSRGAPSFPFTVRAVGAGSGTAALGDESDARGELWLPLWRRPVRLPELRTLLAEGRATVHRRTARDGLDFVRAVSGLGVDRGIDAFERYAFMMRSGRAYLAAPLGRVQVRARPEIALTDQLEADGYLESLRRFARGAGAPGSVRRLVGLLEGSLFELARHGGSRRLQEILMTLGELQQVVGASRAARDAGVRPLPALSYQWVRDADDGSDELRVAAALAGLHGDRMPMRCHLAPVDPRDKPRRWAPESSLTVWGSGELVPNLLRVLERRLLEAVRRDLKAKPFGGAPAADTPAVVNFLHGAAGRGRIDDRRIARLLAGLAFVRSPKFLKDRQRPDPPVPAAFAVLKPLFVEPSVLQEAGLLSRDSSLPLPGAVVANLAAGHTQRAVDLAWHRLRVAGVSLPRYPAIPPSAAGFSGARLAAALMIPLNERDVARILKRLTIDDHRREDTPAKAPTT